MRAAPAIGLALVAAVAGCQKSESWQDQTARIETESAAFRQMLPAVARRYEQFTAAGQADSIAALYDDVGRQMPPNEPAAAGRAAIRDRQARLASYGSWELHVTPRSAMANGRTAVEDGKYVISFKPGPKAPAGMGAMTDSGKYLAHWLQESDKSWKILQLAWNSDLPMPMPPAAGKRR